MKLSKKFIVTFFILILALGYATCVPKDIRAAPQVPKSTTYYLSTKPYVTGITINGWYKLKKSAIKSSNKKIIEINDVTRTEGKGGKSTSIMFSIKKPGSSTISFKIDKKKYQTKIYAKKYKNPAKFISITGVKAGDETNLASLLNKTSSFDKLKLDKTVKDPRIKVTAKKGWKISSLNYQTLANNPNEESGNRYYKSPVSKAEMPIFSKTKELKKDAGGYYVEVGLVNTKDGAHLSLGYYIDVGTHS